MTNGQIKELLLQALELEFGGAQARATEFPWDVDEADDERFEKAARDHERATSSRMERLDGSRVGR